MPVQLQKGGGWDAKGRGVGDYKILIFVLGYFSDLLQQLQKVKTLVVELISCTWEQLKSCEIGPILVSAAAMILGVHR